MKPVLILILATVIGVPCAQAKSHGTGTTGAAAYRFAPAQEMLQTLNSMSALLNSVHSRQNADMADPRLSDLYQQYIAHRNAAENMPPMSERNMSQHLAQMDSGMNTFRLACARLIQLRFYGSAKLGRTVKKIAQDF